MKSRAAYTTLRSACVRRSNRTSFWKTECVTSNSSSELTSAANPSGPLNVSRTSLANRVTNVLPVFSRASMRPFVGIPSCDDESTVDRRVMNSAPVPLPKGANFRS